MRRSSGASYQKLEITQVTSADSSKRRYYRASSPLSIGSPVIRSIQACLVLLALVSVGLAQFVTPAQNDERELWLVRSQNITNDVLKDAGDLSSMQRAVLWVKLGQRWWRDDQKRAGSWIL